MRALVAVRQRLETHASTSWAWEVWLDNCGEWVKEHGQEMLTKLKEYMAEPPSQWRCEDCGEASFLPPPCPHCFEAKHKRQIDRLIEVLKERAGNE